jgi:phosphatidate cytidylyltransferase
VAEIVTRVVTALVILPLVLAAVFLLSGWSFLLFVLTLVEIAAIEYALLASRLVDRRVMWIVPALMPIAALLLLPDLLGNRLSPADHLLWLGFLTSGGIALWALFSRISLEKTILATGLASFGVLYFSVPVAALIRLHARDVWLVILVAVIVWAGDTAAFYVGTYFGRHRLAPIVSPNKTWEGAIAGLVAALMATAIWSAARVSEIDLGLLVVAGATSIAAQAGDLVESTLKRRVGVKDSSALLPGHGGMLDRLDSLLFAIPTLAIGLVVIGWELP